MVRPVIAVSGSTNPRREYRRPLSKLDRAPEVCRALDRALADAGWDLLVFSEDDSFVEADGSADGGPGESGTRRGRPVRAVAPRRCGTCPRWP